MRAARAPVTTAPVPVKDAPRRLRAVVAIPVRNEEARVEACLRALDGQVGLAPGSWGVVLFLNNCTDATAARVAALRPDLALRLRMVERVDARASAGWARREAMDLAFAWLSEAGEADGAILTTDADSRVPPDWLCENLAALAAGADAVAGRIALDPAEAAALPDALHARGRLEGEYEALLTELCARLDPVAHDPWPCHWTESGATLAVTASAYARVGGMPPLPLGEDRAFVAALRSLGARVRHAPDIAVVTSGRLDGRAAGGAADTMRRRCERPESPCDPRLEALPRVLWRLFWLRRIRALHARGGLGRLERWAPFVGVPREVAREIARLPRLAGVLAAIDVEVRRRPLRPRHLRWQIAGARLALAIARPLAPLPTVALPGGAGAGEAAPAVASG